MSKSILVAVSLIILLESVGWAKVGPNTDTEFQILRNPQLLKAIENLDANAVKSALYAGANPNCSLQRDNEKRRSALCLSILSAEVSRNDYLNSSADSKCEEVLKLLISKGASLQYHDQDILYHAIRKELLGVTELLLKAGADPKFEVYGKKPIEVAIEVARDDIVELLIEHGAGKINEKDAKQLRFIYLAGLSPREVPEYTHPIIEMQKLLLTGAEVNAANRFGERALHKAFFGIPSVEKYSTVMFLFQNGANPNLLAKTFGNKSQPVFNCFVFWEGMSRDIAENFKTNQPIIVNHIFLHALENNGVDVSLVDSEGKTALHAAAEFDNLSFVKSLLNEDGLNIKDKNGKLPLDYAKSAEIIKLLKAHGAKGQKSKDEQKQ